MYVYIASYVASCLNFNFHIAIYIIKDHVKSVFVKYCVPIYY